MKMATHQSTKVSVILKQLKATDRRYQFFTVLKGGEVSCAICSGTSIQYRNRFSLSRHLATKSHWLACKL